MKSLLPVMKKIVISSLKIVGVILEESSNIDKKRKQELEDAAKLHSCNECDLDPVDLTPCYDDDDSLKL